MGQGLPLMPQVGPVKPAGLEARRMPKGFFLTCASPLVKAIIFVLTALAPCAQAHAVANMTGDFLSVGVGDLQKTHQRYDAYGKRTVFWADGRTARAVSAFGNQTGFTGRYHDDETGLMYFRARYYSAELGRFVNRDPAGYVDGYSLYGAYFVPGATDPDGRTAMVWGYSVTGAMMATATALGLEALATAAAAKAVGAVALAYSAHCLAVRAAIAKAEIAATAATLAITAAQLAGDSDKLELIAAALDTFDTALSVLEAMPWCPALGADFSKRNGLSDRADSLRMQAKATKKQSCKVPNAPKRVTNTKHHPNSPSPEPKNVDDLFKDSVEDSVGRRWVKDTDGVIHRFSKESNGETHWNGSTKGPEGIRMEDIPNAIRKLLK